MGADANLFAQYLKPVRSVQDFNDDADRRELARLQLEGAKGQNALLSLTREQQGQAAQQQMAERNALQRLAATWGANTTVDQRVASLRNSGMPGLMSQADALEKQAIDRRKVEADAGKADAETLSKRLDTLKFLSTSVMANPTPQNAALALDAFERMSGLQLPEERQRLALLQTPEQVKAWAAGHALAADKMLPQVQTRNTGGTTDTLAIDPLTGKPTVTGSVRNTVSPDAALSAATQRRGQDMTDARARENTAATLTKPFEVTGPDGLPMLVQQDKTGKLKPVDGFGPKSGASKPLNDTQAKALLFGTRMQEANKVLESLEGKYSPAAVNTKMGAENLPVIGGLAGMVGNATMSAEGQQAEQAQRDFVNAVLRRESGAVIAPSEFANAQKQYFPQPGDKPENLAQKKRNRELAIAGLLAEVPEGRRASITPKAETGTKKIATDAEYEALPSGATFVGPDGKTRRKP